MMHSRRPCGRTNGRPEAEPPYPLPCRARRPRRAVTGPEAEMDYVRFMCRAAVPPDGGQMGGPRPSRPTISVVHMSTYPNNWAVVIPLANEEAELPEFSSVLRAVMDELGGGMVYFVVDRVSKDRTLECCQELGRLDSRLITKWIPENRNVVDAYLNGFKEALKDGHEIIIEMDGGLSHDPRAIPAFLRALNEGNDCAFGSRYINGGSMVDSPIRRRILSKGGTLLAQWLLGAELADMTSGYQAFRRSVMLRVVDFPLRSQAHFYQTELRYLLRKQKLIEVPIHYRAPSPRVSHGAIRNSLAVLTYYFLMRILGRPPAI